MAVLIRNSQRLMKLKRKAIGEVTGELLASLKLHNRDLSILLVIQANRA